MTSGRGGACERLLDWPAGIADLAIDARDAHAPCLRPRECTLAGFRRPFGVGPGDVEETLVTPGELLPNLLAADVKRQLLLYVQPHAGTPPPLRETPGSASASRSGHSYSATLCGHGASFARPITSGICGSPTSSSRRIGAASPTSGYESRATSTTRSRTPSWRSTSAPAS